MGVAQFIKPEGANRRFWSMFPQGTPFWSSGEPQPNGSRCGPAKSLQFAMMSYENKLTRQAGACRAVAGRLPGGCRAVAGRVGGEIHVSHLLKTRGLMKLSKGQSQPEIAAAFLILEAWFWVHLLLYQVLIVIHVSNHFGSMENHGLELAGESYPRKQGLSSFFVGVSFPGEADHGVMSNAQAIKRLSQQTAALEPKSRKLNGHAVKL